MNRPRSCAGIEKSKPKDIRSTFSPLTCSRRNVQASRGARESREHIKTVAGIRGKPFHSFGTRWIPSLAASNLSTPPQNEDLSFHGSLKRFSLVLCASAPKIKKKSPSSSTRMRVFFCETLSMLHIIYIVYLIVYIVTIYVNI